MKYYLAIDIGASSGRHIIGWREQDTIQTKEIYRFPNSVHMQDGHYIWDIHALTEHVICGIREAFLQYPSIESLSIDTWGVDYVLLHDTETIFPVYAYRDTRTEAVIPALHEQIPFSELYRHTGCQFQPFNTIYQLYCDLQSGRLESATDFLMIPEYLLWKLSGVKAKEFTNATTTGMISAATGTFDSDIIRRLGFPPHLFGTLSAPGTVLGPLLPDIAAKVGGNCNVVLCATHDTASAVEGIPMSSNQPYISSGTWSLLGVKTKTPLTDNASEFANYSNEGGVSYNRYQKNIMGMWLINELRRELCPELSFEQIVCLAQESDCTVIVDANAPCFLSPDSMRRAFDTATGHVLRTPADYFCCAYHSLADSYHRALSELEHNTAQHYDRLYIVGGGAKNQFLNRLTEKATNKEVIALPIEATALGNLKIQMEVSV